FVKLFNNVNPSWIEKYKDDIIKEPIIKKSNDNYTFHFIGNIDDTRKGLHLLLGASKKLLDNNYKVVIKIIGSGKLLDKYRDEYKDYPTISFLGYLPNPMKELKESDLLIVPSLADSFPNTIMEALYLEIPVIGSKKGGIPEMLEYDELLFEANVDSLYDKLYEIINNSSLEELRQLCIKRKKILTFNWAEKIKELL
ncbi:MAG: glycosyltransferase family 4 protein, partial [Promethearchaeota archaeon]